MALICDTSGVYALYDADDSHHADVRAAAEAEVGELFLPVLLLAEIDYLLTSRLGVQASLDFLESIQDRTFDVIPFSDDDIVRFRELIEQYRDLGIGLCDASVVATAESLKLARLLTLDQRHFRAITPRGLGHFVLLPADR